MDNKRLIYAVVLMLLIYYLAQTFFWPKNKLPEQLQQQSIQTTETKPAPVLPDSTATVALTAITPTDTTNSVEVNDAIILISDNLKLRFSNRGAVLTGIELTNFTSHDKTSTVQLIPENEQILGIEMITSVRVDLSKHVFEYSLTENGIRFYVPDESGNIVVEKIFTLTDSNNLNMKFSVNSNEAVNSYTIALASGIRDTEIYTKYKSRDYKIVAQIDNKIERLSLSKLEETRELGGNIAWAGIRSKYFGIGIIPEQRLRMNHLKGLAVNTSPAMYLTIVNPTSGSTFTDEFNMYIGALDYKRLGDFYGNGIENMAEMGAKWLRYISIAFLWLLQMLFKVLPNYGVSLIAFALVLKIVLYPLAHKSMESSTRMQQIQPFVKSIQKKYKKDPRKMNEEIQKLYKEHGVSPLGGCLPLLLQMPIFFALYPVLRYSIELRQANFMFWIQDLSEPDQYWVLPILMGISMFVQQMLMTPSKADLEKLDEKQRAMQTNQRMMMYIMPVMMFFIFRNMPSGLVLYWMIFNVLSIFQQYWIKKKFKTEKTK
ncbi:MAG: membrane protein insertase YidC [Candidatus Cloacimonetes bacterium]|nr:membrane protein insertase YidC [Candidatus Cloacimonadota bacterium]